MRFQGKAYTGPGHLVIGPTIEPLIQPQAQAIYHVYTVSFLKYLRLTCAF